MQIDIICVGKVKEQYLRDAIAEYSKRLGRYCKLNILEVADEKTPEHASEGVERQIKAKEGERIAKHIKPGAYVIALAIDGQQVTSEGFARKIDQLGIQGVSHIQFVIGGSIGMDDAILRRADYRVTHSVTPVTVVVTITSCCCHPVTVIFLSRLSPQPVLRSASQPQPHHSPCGTNASKIKRSNRSPHASSSSWLRTVQATGIAPIARVNRTCGSAPPCQS